MRKSLVLLLVLLSLSIGTVCVALGEIGKEKDQVHFTENIIYGDKALVEGVTIEMKNRYDNKLFWNSRYTIGKTPKEYTEYDFSTLGKDVDIYEVQGSFYMENYASDTISTDILEKEEENLQGLELAWKELYDMTSPGEEREMLINVKDYVDYYPISTMSFDDPWKESDGGKRFGLWLCQEELYSERERSANKPEQLEAIDKKINYLKTFPLLSFLNDR